MPSSPSTRPSTRTGPAGGRPTSTTRGADAARRSPGPGSGPGANSRPSPACPTRSGRSSCTTKAIGSLNARYRRAAQARGRFPNEQAALERLYLAALALDPTGRGRQRWNNRWKSALHEFDVLFDGRLTAGRVQAAQPTEEPVGQTDESHLTPDPAPASKSP
ncbi:transposase [Streptomyces sp. NPDC005774]|uniref:transposase n=1 Tax=Streptomyces sp. NPDC005774 TaxID=3364728 RepID=UPI00368DAC44